MVEFYFVESLINEPGSFWLNLLVTFIGTGLGFFGAFYLTKKGDRKQKEKESEIKRGMYIDRLVYLSKLIESCIDTSKKQIEKFEDLAYKIEKAPIEKHLLDLIASKDLQRLQNIDTEEVFHAYLFILPDDKEKLSDYIKLLSSIDYLVMELEQSITSTEKQVNFVFSHQLYIKDRLETLYREIVTCINDIIKKNSKYSTSPEYLFLYKYSQKYEELINNRAQFEQFELDYLAPFNTDLDNKDVGSYNYSKLHTLANEAIIRFDHIRLNANVFVQDLKDIRSRTEKSISSLESINIKIKASTNNYNK